jgi:hypothetical protein
MRRGKIILIHLQLYFFVNGIYLHLNSTKLNVRKPLKERGFITISNCHMKVLHYIARACLPFFFIVCLKDRLVAQVNQVQSDILYLDTNAPIDKYVRDLISRLTLEEKATLLNHRGPLVERFKIKSDGWNQSLYGVRWNQPTTMFRVSLSIAATWNTTLIHLSQNLE